MNLTREAFLLLDDSDTAFVELPEHQLEGQAVPTVRVRSLMCDQRQRLFDRSRDLREKGIPIPGGLNALCCAMGLIDDKGLLLFPDENNGAILMGRKHPEIVARIAGRVYELSDMTKAQRLDAEKKSQLTKPSDSLGSSLPEASSPATE